MRKLLLPEEAHRSERVRGNNEVQAAESHLITKSNK